MSHTIIVNSEEDGALAWKLPEDLSAALDCIAEQHPQLTEITLALIRSHLSQISGIIATTTRYGLGNEHYLNLLTVGLKHLQERIEFFTAHPQFTFFKLGGGQDG